MRLLDDIARRVDESFSAPDRDRAAALLLRARVHDGSPADPRLIRCALEASRGSLETLQHYVNLLAVDYREVIMAAEYDSIDGALVRVRDLSQPFGPSNQRLERP